MKKVYVVFLFLILPCFIFAENTSIDFQSFLDCYGKTLDEVGEYVMSNYSVQGEPDDVPDFGIRWISYTVLLYDSPCQINLNGNDYPDDKSLISIEFQFRNWLIEGRVMSSEEYSVVLSTVMNELLIL